MGKIFSDHPLFYIDQTETNNANKKNKKNNHTKKKRETFLKRICIINQEREGSS
jgi:hypothetical protein